MLLAVAVVVVMVVMLFSSNSIDGNGLMNDEGSERFPALAVVTCSCTRANRMSAITKKNHHMHGPGPQWRNQCRCNSRIPALTIYY